MVLSVKPFPSAQPTTKRWPSILRPFRREAVRSSGLLFTLLLSDFDNIKPLTRALTDTTLFTSILNVTALTLREGLPLSRGGRAGVGSNETKRQREQVIRLPAYPTTVKINFFK